MVQGEAVECDFEKTIIIVLRMPDIGRTMVEAILILI